ncbi:hypothetical protein L6452_27104 [Arctium lappa]|uniref:Uncharacterized protein n=1 Tax=Arctium lappa TaxID=4217 RepID=A0ACB8ZW51_ARCLA|nr:hypothetical protein L6452_27104 [Arctium lappa]
MDHNMRRAWPQPGVKRSIEVNRVSTQEGSGLRPISIDRYEGLVLYRGTRFSPTLDAGFTPSRKRVSVENRVSPKHGNGSQ